MPMPEALRKLCTVLAQLYPDKASAIRVAEDAGIPIAAVALSERALDNWHEILKEVQKRNRLALLLELVDEEYGANPDFRAVKERLGDQPSTPPQFTPAALDSTDGQLITPRRIGFAAIVVGVLVIIGLWTFDLLGQPGQPAATPTASATVATPAATPQSLPDSFTYGVTVKDDSTHQPIRNAEVLIEVAGKAPLDEYTDSKGYARIVVPASHAERPGRLTVNAQGYAVEVKNIDLYQDQLPDEMRLTRQ